MFNATQLKFMRAALCSKGVAIPTEDGGTVARIFLSTLAEIDDQLVNSEKNEKSRPTPAVADNDAKPA